MPSQPFNGLTGLPTSGFSVFPTSGFVYKWVSPQVRLTTNGFVVLYTSGLTHKWFCGLLFIVLKVLGESDSDNIIVFHIFFNCLKFYFLNEAWL